MLKRLGEWKIWAFSNHPKHFEVIEDAMLAEEWYWCKCKYTDRNGNIITEIKSVRLRWKPWEYYYNLEPAWSEEDMIEYLKDGSLNSQETDRAMKLMREQKEMQQSRAEV
jgi:hypothetical protein